MGKKSGLRRGEGNVERHGAGYRVRYVDVDGVVRRKGGFASEQAARAWLVSRDAGSREPVAVTVRVVVEDYLNRGRRRWSGATQAAYRARAETHILPKLGKIRLDKLTTLQVQKWVDTLDASGLKPSTVQGAHSVLSGALKEAVRLGLVERNAATGVRLPAMERSQGRAWTAAECQRVLQEVSDTPRWYALYQLVLTTGLRPGEVRALRWDDVDWARARLAVRRTVAHAAGGGYEVKESTKTGTSRVVPLTLPALRALEVWRKANAGAWVFSEGAGPLRQHIWTQMHTRVCERAGVPVIRLHDLRHTAISLLLERGVAVRTVADIAGHQDLTTTLGVYAHSSERALREAADGLADALNVGEDAQRTAQEM